tara:strand:- start:1270 stop:1437 length:168 start_codon:yes stop_codon:yes gene_type:complete
MALVTIINSNANGLGEVSVVGAMGDMECHEVAFHVTGWSFGGWLSGVFNLHERLK